ncbi:MAG: GNAT family N-acetyltransferase [Candidatus Bathyarchaeota archaeon]|nr:GNAT family N-acetyltransferase [Candidatus Bathyarchaeota archaeon]
MQEKTLTVLEILSESQPQGSVYASMYDPTHWKVWDSFVSASKNGTFLLLRNYMDYHSDRFQDHSLMFYRGDELVALMPANIEGDTLYSHAGLTYGGVISGYDMDAPLMHGIFEELQNHCQSIGVKKVIYKAIPPIYHSAPAEEDLYALFKYHANLIGRNLSSCIFLSEKKRFHKKRRESVTKAKNHGVTVRQSFDFGGFMGMVEQVVNGRHGSKPVHTSSEMMLLANRFPENIKLFGAYQADKMLAGCLIYETPNVAHGQYAANLDAGRALGAQDAIIDYLVNCYYVKHRYFDFGISTLNNGRFLNEGLVNHKESFGASAIVYDIYEMPIKMGM